jgi:poly-gamma-glutamate synthesis protein (capsule biosynthesis protein)
MAAAMRAKGDTFPFLPMMRILQRADIAFVNLECVLAESGRPIPKQYNFRGSPKGAKALRDAGIDIVSQANNHAWDFGPSALAETAGHLAEAGIVNVGGGRTLEEAHRLRVVERNGLKIGFLAYLGMFPPLMPMRSGRPGIAMGYPDVVSREVAAARRKVDVLVVSMHAGVEGARRHSPRQQRIARAAVDAGADLVIGHHPHVVQDVEIYRGKPIVYSLGNFVFDPSASARAVNGRGWSALLLAELQKGCPPKTVLVDLRIRGSQVHLANPGWEQPILQWLQKGGVLPRLR